MSAKAVPEEQVEEQPAILPPPQPEATRRSEYLVHTQVRTMLGNPSALYHGKVVVIQTNFHQQIMTEKMRRKEENKRKNEEKKLKKLEKKKAWEEQKKMKMEEDAQRTSKVAAPVQEVAKPAEEQTVENREAAMVTFEEPGVSPEAIYCNTCGGLSYGNRVEYEYSVSTHLTATFLAICCYCWLPYILRCCMDEVYYCSLCGAYLGKTPTLSRRNMF